MVGLLVGTIIGLIIGIAIPNSGMTSRNPRIVNVTNVNVTYFDTQTNNAYLGGVLSGFQALPGSVTYYNFSVVYKNSSYSETIESVNTMNAGFSLIRVIPPTPSVIPPQEHSVFSLEVRVPDQAYTGPLNIVVLYKINYEANASHGS